MTIQIVTKYQYNDGCRKIIAMVWEGEKCIDVASVDYDAFKNDMHLSVAATAVGMSDSDFIGNWEREPVKDETGFRFTPIRYRYAIHIERWEIEDALSRGQGRTQDGRLYTKDFQGRYLIQSN